MGKTVHQSCFIQHVLMATMNDFFIFFLEQSVWKRLSVVVSQWTSKCLLWQGINDQLINDYSDWESCECTLLLHCHALYLSIIQHCHMGDISFELNVSNSHYRTKEKTYCLYYM